MNVDGVSFVTGEIRPLLPAVVGPLAAAVIDREMGRHLRRMARELLELGQEDASRQLSTAVAQMQESARQLFERTSPAGSAEVPQSPQGAGSESPPGVTEWWSTEVAAEQLGVGARQVRNLAGPGGPLVAATLGGRLLIDPVSVVAEVDRRRRARGEAR